MSKKYELVMNDSIEYCQKTLYRIRALESFADVKVGDLGGYIESEKNLSHYNSCWVYDNAKVMDNASVIMGGTIHNEALVADKAIVADAATVYKNATICGHALLFDQSTVGGTARVAGRAVLKGYANVRGNASIEGCAHVESGAIVYDNAHVYGDSLVCGDAMVYGTADVHGSACVCGNARIENKFSVMSATNILSDGSDLTFFVGSDNSIFVVRGRSTKYVRIDDFEKGFLEMDTMNLDVLSVVNLITVARIRLSRGVFGGKSDS